MEVIQKAPKSMVHGDEMILLNHPYIHQFLKDQKHLSFIEIGSQRGTGSTYRLSRYSKQHNMHFITVDADETNSKGAGEIIAQVDKTYEAHHQLGEVYLENYTKKDIGICYLDAFDLVTSWPHKQSTIDSYTKRNSEFSNEAAYKMHFDANKAILDKVVPGGFIAYDDVWKNEKGEWEGKGKTGIPYMLQHGYIEICYYNNSALFQRVGGLSGDKLALTKKYSKPQKLGFLYQKRRILSLFK